MASTTELGRTRRLQKHLTSRRTSTSTASCTASTASTSSTRILRMIWNRCSNVNWHVQPSWHIMFTKPNLQEGYRKEAQALSVLMNQLGTSKNQRRWWRSWQVELDPPRGNKWAQHVHDHCIQSMQKIRTWTRGWHTNSSGDISSWRKRISPALLFYFSKTLWSRPNNGEQQGIWWFFSWTTTNTWSMEL